MPPLQGAPFLELRCSWELSHKSTFSGNCILQHISFVHQQCRKPELHTNWILSYRTITRLYMYIYIFYKVRQIQMKNFSMCWCCYLFFHLAVRYVIVFTGDAESEYVTNSFFAIFSVSYKQTMIKSKCCRRASKIQCQSAFVIFYLRDVQWPQNSVRFERLLLAEILIEKEADKPFCIWAHLVELSFTSID